MVLVVTGGWSGGPGWHRLTGVVILCAILCMGLTGCREPEKAPRNLLLSAAPETPPDTGRLLVLGLDSMNWYTLGPLLRRGMLPALERVRMQAARGDLKTLKPTLSDVIWTTIMTGKLPAAHGITAVLVADPATGAMVPAASSHRRVAALWNMLSGRGVPAVFVKWLVSWPAERMRGGMVTQRYRYEELPDRDYPEGVGLAPPAAPRWPGPEYDDAVALRQDRASRYHMAYLQDWIPDDLVTFGQGIYAQKKLRPTVLAVFFWGLDRIQHHYFAATHIEPRGVAAWAGAPRVIPAYYEYYDGFVAEYLADCGYETVVILSDHGMEEADDPNRFMVQAKPEPGAKQFRVRQVSLNRVLAEMGLLVMDDEGRIDWQRTVLYEAEGRFDPWRRELYMNPDDRVAGARDAAMEKVRGIRDESGVALFAGVTAAPGRPGVIQCRLNNGVPDDARLVLNRVVPLGALIESQVAGTGQHHHAPPGILLVAGDAVEPGILARAAVADVCPTVLTALGLPVARDMDGKALPVFTARFRAEHPPATVDSYDGMAVRRVPGSGGKTSVDEELEERMRRLGYL
ncbi:alkaline phosphatase family protein [bacterium]|nr:alkaline phosphatase family protein [candidate division CSSED10-310 bacterium]